MDGQGEVNPHHAGSEYHQESDFDPKPTAKSNSSLKSGKSRRFTDKKSIALRKRSKGFCPGISHPQFEPRDTIFADLCEEYCPDYKWDDLSVREQAGLLYLHLVAKVWLIDPHSKYANRWNMIMFSALFFVAFITPVEVAFMEVQLDFLFAMNRLIDLIFLKDMAMQFVLKIQIRSNATGELIWLNRRRHIASHYLKGWFFCDLLSLFPWDVISLMVGASSDLKAFRLIRLMRFFKLMRLLRASRIIHHFETNTSVHYGLVNLIKFVVLVVALCHWEGCIWGAFGLHFSDLKCDGRVVVAEKPLEPSWITKRFGEDGLGQPDSPCDVGHLYAVSLHWSIATITSIGYGDVTAVRWEEKIVSVVCMLVGGFTWAYLVGNTCEVLSNLDELQAKYEQTVDNLNFMCRDQFLSNDFHRQLRNYFRASQYLNRLSSYKELTSQMSTQLRREFSAYSSQNSLGQIWYLRDEDEKFLQSLMFALVPSMFNQREVVQIRNTLFIIENGLAARGGKLMLREAIWGEDLIIKVELQNHERVTALTYLAVVSLTKDALESILEDFPAVAKRVQEVAQKFTAHRRWTTAVRKIQEKNRAESDRRLRGEVAVEEAVDKKDDDCQGDDYMIGDITHMSDQLMQEAYELSRKLHELQPLWLSDGNANSAQTSDPGSTLPSIDDADSWVRLENKIDEVVFEQSRTARRVEMLEDMFREYSAGGAEDDCSMDPDESGRSRERTDPVAWS